MVLSHSWRLSRPLPHRSDRPTPDSLPPVFCSAFPLKTLSELHPSLSITIPRTSCPFHTTPLARLHPLHHPPPAVSRQARLTITLTRPATASTRTRLSSCLRSRLRRNSSACTICWRKLATKRHASSHPIDAALQTWQPDSLFHHESWQMTPKTLHPERQNS